MLLQHFWTTNANILASRNHPEMVQYSMKSSLREDSEKYWNSSWNSLWAEISHLQYRCFTKRLLLLKVYHKLLDLHHTGQSIYDDDVCELQLRISRLVGISQKWLNTPWQALCERILKSIETLLGTSYAPRCRIYSIDVVPNDLFCLKSTTNSSTSTILAMSYLMLWSCSFTNTHPYKTFVNFNCG